MTDEAVSDNLVWERWTQIHVASRSYDVESFRDGRRPLRVTRLRDRGGRPEIHWPPHLVPTGVGEQLYRPYTHARDGSRSTTRTTAGPLTSLIGREADIREVERLLGEHRLVTLTGAGGSGKTRVAIAVASRSRGDGATFVALEDTHDIEEVVVQVADALGITERPGTDLVATVESYLADRRLLLVLDNFEQVLPAAPLVQGSWRQPPVSASS